MDDIEHAKIQLQPGPLKNRRSRCHITLDMGRLTVKEFIIKGTVDPEWLKMRLLVEK